MAGFFKSLLNRFTKPEIDWDDLEASLIAGDLGPKLAEQIVAEVKERGGRTGEEEKTREASAVLSAASGHGIVRGVPDWAFCGGVGARTVLELPGGSRSYEG